MVNANALTKTSETTTGTASNTNIPTANKNVNEKFSREPERLNKLRRQNEELKQREYALTLKSRSKRYKACSDLSCHIRIDFPSSATRSTQLEHMRCFLSGGQLLTIVLLLKRR